MSRTSAICCFPLIARHRLAGLDADITFVSPVGGPAVWHDCVATVLAVGRSRRPSSTACCWGAATSCTPGRRRRRLPPRRPHVAARLHAASGSRRARSPQAAAAAVLERAGRPAGHEPARRGGAALGGDRRRATSASATPTACATFGTPASTDRARSCPTPRSTSRRSGRTTSSPRRARRSSRRGAAALAAHHRRPSQRAYITDPAQSLAERLDRIAARADATPVLLALGPCHGDGAVARSVGAKMSSDPLVVDRPRSLRQIVAAIAGPRPTSARPCTA